MQIKFKSEGGFAFIPGIQRPVELDTARMSPAEAAHLESLIGSADFFNLPPEVGTLARGAADQPTYTISIESHTVVVVEGAASPPLQRLIDRLRTPGRSGARGGGTAPT